MKLFPDMKVLLEIGPFSITWYAFLIVTGAIIAFELSVRNLKKMGYSKALAEDLFYGALPAGIIGARLWYVAFEWPQYARNLISIFYLWEGGLGIYGGVFAGMLYGYYFTKKHKLSYLRWADAIVPNILVAQAIGRWGNFMNQEAYGRIVSEAYYRLYPAFIKTRMFIEGSYREPTFLYESSLNILGFLLITLVYKKYAVRKRGDLMFAYFGWYGVVRFFVEGLRSDSLYFLGLRVSQLTSIILIGIAIAGLLGVFRKWMYHKPVVLFDLDGTLLDTKALIEDSLRYVFGKYEPELKLTEELLESCLGPSLQTIFQTHSTKDTDLLVQEYITHNQEQHPALLKEFPNALKTLKQLKEQGYLVGVVSTKRRDSIELGLSLCHMTEYVDVIVGAADVQKQKPDPEGIFMACEKLGVSRDWVIYVGDNKTDIQAGKAAGAFTIGVNWSTKGAAVLMEENPDRMIGDLLEVVAVAKEEFA